MRVALGIEYNGTNYCGWQDQPHCPTIEAAVTKAVAKVANHEVKLLCAGRTDAGVHAKEQVVHFDTMAMRKDDSWVLGANSHLAHDIVIRWARVVDADFHARFSALARRYRYLLYINKTRPAILHNQVTWQMHELDIAAMQKAAEYLLGEHDFSSFRGSGCQSKSPMRNIHAITIIKQGKLITIDVKANAFLLHMVRNIVGVLMVVGLGKESPLWVEHVLESCDRKVAALTAPASGLYLTKVYYPDKYHL